MKKFKLKVKAAPAAKAKKLKPRVHVGPKFRIPGTMLNGKFVPFPGYHTTPTPGYIEVFDPNVPGKRPVPKRMANETEAAFNLRWRRHFGLQLPDEALWEGNGKPPLPEHQAYMRGQVIYFKTPKEFRKEDEEAARKAAMTKIVVKRGSILMREMPKPKIAEKKPAPKLIIKKHGDIPAEILKAAENPKTTLATMVKLAVKNKMVLRPQLVPTKKAFTIKKFKAEDFKAKPEITKERKKAIVKTFNVKRLEPSPAIAAAKQKAIALFKMKRK